MEEKLILNNIFQLGVDTLKFVPVTGDQPCLLRVNIDINYQLPIQFYVPIYRKLMSLCDSNSNHLI